MGSDEEQLRLLSVFHYVVGGLGMLFSCFPIIHLVIGIAMLVGAIEGEGGETPPPLFAWLFVLLPGAFILVGWTVSLFILIAGHKLRARRSYTYCFLVACVECAFVPLGTVLGAFTIIVLNKDSVKELFTASEDVKPGQASPY